MNILSKIKADPRYVEGLTYGKPRKGHAEGTVAKHIEELERTLHRLIPLLTDEEFCKLEILIHTHDTFKLEGKRRTGHQVSIRDANSHASLARKFLGEFTKDPDLLTIAQYHDEGHSLWMKWKKKGKYDEDRLQDALRNISNVELYAIFTIIDGYTSSKLVDRSPRWFVDEVNKHVKTPRAYEALEVLGI